MMEKDKPSGEEYLVLVYDAEDGSLEPIVRFGDGCRYRQGVGFVDAKGQPVEDPPESLHKRYHEDTIGQTLRYDDKHRPRRFDRL